MTTAIIRHTSPSHRFHRGDRVHVNGAGGIEQQTATVKEAVLVSGEPGYVLQLDNGKEDLVHVDLVQPLSRSSMEANLSNQAQSLGLGQRVTWTSEGYCLDGAYRLGHTEADAHSMLRHFQQGRTQLNDYLRARRQSNPLPIPSSARQNYKGQQVPPHFFTRSTLRNFAYGTMLEPQLLRLWSTDAARKALYQEALNGRGMEPFHQLINTARLFEAGDANYKQLDREFRLAWELLQSYDRRSSVSQAGRVAIEASRESPYSGGWLPSFYDYMTQHAGYTNEEVGEWLGARILWLEGYQNTAGERGLLLLLQDHEPVYSHHDSVRVDNPASPQQRRSNPLEAQDGAAFYQDVERRLINEQASGYGENLTSLELAKALSSLGLTSLAVGSVVSIYDDMIWEGFEHQEALDDAIHAIADSARDEPERFPGYLSPRTGNPGKASQSPKRQANPWGKLTDGREVYWMKERTPTSAERLTELLGHPVTWEGFLSKAEKTRRNLTKDGFIMVVDGKEIGLGRSVDEAIQSSNAHIIARNKAIFSGSLGAALRQSPELLQEVSASEQSEDLQAIAQFVIREVEQFENYRSSTTEKQDGFLVEVHRQDKKIGSFRISREQVGLSGVDGMARKRLSRIHRLAQKLHENLKPLSREANPASPSNYGYRNEVDLQFDLARLARDLPSPYEPPSQPIQGAFQLGNGTDVFVVTKDGVETYKGRYLLVEADTLEASHIPTDIGPFGINPRYPEGVQERRYHKDPQEAAKVRNNARRFMPGLVINTNPDAVNGPPIVDSHMIVLGGNSRTMTQQLLYSQGKGDAIKNFLAASCSAGCFGFTPDDVQAMKAPILARQIDFEAKSEKEKARYLVRVLNEVMTQDLDFASEVTAVANKLTKGQWRQIAQFIANHKADEDTLNSYLLKTASSEFVQLLYELGVLTDRNLSKLVFQNKEKRNYGLLNRFGRRMVSELFLGYLLQSPELIEQMNDQALMVFETIAPYLIVSACCDPAWDLTEDVRIALQAVTAAVIKKDDIYRVMGQLDLFGGESSYSAVQDNPRRKLLFHVLFAYRNSPAKMSKGFKRYAMRASGTNEAAMSLPGTIVETKGGESLQELALAFQATPEDPEKGGSPSGFRLPNDPVLRKLNPEQDISFELPAKGGKTKAIMGVYDTETGQFTPDAKAPYARDLKGQIMNSSGDAGRAWRAMNLLTAAQGMTSEASWQRAARIIEGAIASGIMSESSFQEVRTFLFGDVGESTSQVPAQLEQPQQQRKMAALQGLRRKQDAQKKQAGWVETGDGHWVKPDTEAEANDQPQHQAPPVAPLPDMDELRKSLRAAISEALPGLVKQYHETKATS